MALIRTAIEEGALCITLDRPDKLNALTWAMAEELLEAVADAERDPAIHAIVIRGAGRSFCAGADIAMVMDADPVSQAIDPQNDIEGMKRAADNWRRLWECAKPVIVAVHGHCLGGAVEIVLHADLTIASDDAVFGYPAVRGSGLPDSHMFVYPLGPQWTRRMLLTGDPIDAATAERIGLILEAVPRDRLDEAVRALVRSVARVPQPIRRAVKQVVNQSIELMGYTPLQRANWNEGSMARTTTAVGAFTAIARDQGIREAIAWRDGDARQPAADSIPLPDRS
jgi:enoyl-CoA hydratase